MCGITGFWGAPGSSVDFGPLLDRMIAAMAHRGPDSSGVWCDEGAGLGLGHARLSIIDLSPAGHQPMLSEDGSLAIVYNGEVYNYEAVRAELEAAGHGPASGWRGHSDTEVILEAVRAWGVEAALERFVGMFAFALWDARERSLCLVRDRMGIKPLYYGLAGDTLLFGSQLAPLRAHPAWQGGVDPDALALYFRYLYIPAPHCIHPGMRKLEPGALVRITARDLERAALPEPVRWWCVEDVVLQGLADPLDPADPEGAADALEEILTDAVRLRLVSDVPLGAFLSGGIDSSTVVALMQKVSAGPVKTFSIGSTDPGYDEAHHAKAVARHLGTDHTELFVEEAEAREVIPLLPAMFDEPFADASQIPTFLVSRLARREVVVSLSGDGGDELFGGYNRHILAPGLWGRIGGLPPLARAALAACMRRGGERAVAGAYRLVEPLLPGEKRHAIFREKVQKVVEAMSAPHRAAFYHSLVSFWKETPVAGARLPDTHFTRPHPGLDQLDFASWMMALDALTYLPGDILTKVDRASMAVSLEARVPILDHRVAALAWRVPLALKVADGKGKHILRSVLYRHVPREMVERPKQGFGIPLHAWLRGPLRGWAEELLAPERLAASGLLDPEPVRRAWREHLSGRRNLQYHLWAVLMFQAWLAEGQGGAL